MIVDLIQITTRDDLRLDGAYLASGRSPAIGVDGFCFIHGTGGSFYSSTLFDHLAGRFLEMGCGVLRANTRGHDLVSTAVTSKGGKRQGAAYEVLDDCRHDLAAWLNWLREKCGPRVGLVGHSSGAVKCLYAAVHQADLAPACLLAISPPRLSYSWFCGSASGQEFLETYRRAEELVAKEQPASLMDVKLPLPFLITAAGYLGKYGPEERYNFLNFLPGIIYPTLITLGEKEVAGNMAFQGLPEAIRAGKKKAPVEVEVIAGADHFYSGVREALSGAVGKWLGKIVKG